MRNATLAVSQSEVFDLLTNIDSAFTVEFIKRTNGERRVMRGSRNNRTLKVHANKAARNYKGGAAKYDLADKGLVLVIDLDYAKGNRSHAAIRSIPADSVLWVKVGNTVYTVSN